MEAQYDASHAVTRTRQHIWNIVSITPRIVMVVAMSTWSSRTLTRMEVVQATHELPDLSFDWIDFGLLHWAGAHGLRDLQNEDNGLTTPIGNEDGIWMPFPILPPPT
jgi:hypothetical protein